uniref:Exoribonuclease phosphorolytic domain-containing protein n=1 Tax=Megaselia scalaris TaxID=36166 RepID=T1GPV6_MEGSC
RLDGRKATEYRSVDIALGSDATCVVSLGATKVMAHASCELVQPKAFRPNEGILTISVHLDNQGPDDSEHISNVDIVCLNRILEKLLKDSNT